MNWEGSERKRESRQLVFRPRATAKRVQRTTAITCAITLCFYANLRQNVRRKGVSWTLEPVVPSHGTGAGSAVSWC
jgi:hypothetical protein